MLLTVSHTKEHTNRPSFLRWHVKDKASHSLDSNNRDKRLFVFWVVFFCLFLALCVDSSAPLSGSLYISLTLSFLCICADLVIYFFERHLRTVFFARFVFCHFDLEGKWNGRLRLYVWAAALWSLIIPNTSKRIPRDDADLIHDPM